MDDDLNLDLDNIESNVEKKVKVKNRFEELSEKVILTSKERDDALAKAKLEELARIDVEKERDFLKDFSSNVSKYPGAGEYQDKILEKVKSGYSTEDAMVSVLAKEGKLTAPIPEVKTPQAEGGSAPNSFEGPKDISKMTLPEKLEALKEADRTGELSNILRTGM